MNEQETEYKVIEAVNNWHRERNLLVPTKINIFGRSSSVWQVFAGREGAEGYFEVNPKRGVITKHLPGY